MYLAVLNPVDKSFLTPTQAWRLVQAGRAAIVQMNGKDCLRYLDAYESMRLRRSIAEDRAQRMDDAMIDNGRRVVYWNGSADPLARIPPGLVRS
jgi:hypothetical protein